MTANPLLYGEKRLCRASAWLGHSLALLVVAALSGCATASATPTPCQQGRAYKAAEEGDWTPRLFFDRGSAALSLRARELLSSYVFRACHAGVTGVEIIGGIDTSEVGLAEGQLGRRRAETVAALLPTLGFYPAHVSITDYGASSLPVPTGMNVPEPQNRRVILIFR